MSDCIFCKIIAGEIPSTKVFEDDQFLAFMDINPLTRGHCLLIPQAHYETVFTMPQDLLKGLIVTAQKLGDGMMKGLKAKGLNYIQSNGRAANQIIDHYHMHLIPRYNPEEPKSMCWELNPGDMEEIAAAAVDIKGGL
jgi:histidine triad (HIT) family protein